MPRLLDHRNRWQVIDDAVLGRGRFVIWELVASIESQRYPMPKPSDLAVWHTLGARPDEDVRAAMLVLAQLLALPWREQAALAGNRADWYTATLARQLLAALARRPREWTAADADAAVRVASRATVVQHMPALASFAATILERLPDDAGVDRQAVLALRDRLVRSDGVSPRLLERLRRYLAVDSARPVDLGAVSPGDAWGREVREALAALDDPTGVDDVLSVLSMSSLRPTVAWERRVREAAAAAPAANGLLEAMVSAIPHHDLVDPGPYVVRALFTGPNADLARGAVLAWALLDPGGSLRTVADVGVYAGTMPGGSAMARDEKVANACVVALGRIGSDEAVATLGRLGQRIKKRSIRKQLGRALDEAAASAGLSRSELLERVVPAFGLGKDGKKTARVGSRLAELGVEGENVRLRFVGAQGKSLSSVPAAVRDERPAELAELREEAKEASKVLVAERARLEGLMAADREWPLADWARLYRDHPLTGHWARSLVWEVVDGPAVWPQGDGFVDVSGEAVLVPGEAALRLWHPIDEPPGAVEAWRGFLGERGVRQPFKQAWREVYLLTPAEEATGTYSNRFAAHVLRYPQAFALMKGRFWAAPALGYWDGGSEGEAVREFPDGRWRASFCYDLIENDEDGYGTPSLCATDQVRFFEHRGGVWEQVPIADVPPLVFTEAMRDVDLFVGVASIAADPNWADRGHGRHLGHWEAAAFGELSESAATRRAALERLVPRTKIADRCRIDGRFLVVRGRLRTYKIHIGSGNILMEPNDQYLCIVPSRDPRADRIFLPFEEDGGRLSVVVSKAFLLADDDRITDPSILRQIGRG